MGKNRLIKRLYPLFAAAALAALLFQPELARQSVQSGLRLCAEVLIPSLFPFLVLSELCIRLGVLEPLENRLARLMQPCFGVGAGAAGAFIMGLLGGFPSGARAVVCEMESGRLTREEARRAVCFCNNCGPGFLFGFVAVSVFHSVLCGLVLYLIQILSAVCVGMLLKKEPAASGGDRARAKAPPAFSEAFTQSVKSAGLSMLYISAFVSFFSLLSAFSLRFLPDDLPQSLSVFIKGVLELSGGVSALSQIGLPFRAKFLLCSFFAGFGGLCVLAQSAAILHEAGLCAGGMLRARLLQAGLCVFFAWIVTSNGSPLVPAVCFLLTGGIFCLLFRKMRSGNRARNCV